MVITKIRELASAREKLAKLEATIEGELPGELSTLHERYGFDDVKSFLNAIQAATRKKGRKPGRAKKAKVVPKTRKRAKITDAIRAKVKKLVKAGKSGSQIAKAAKISLPSVQNIKKALGLVESRTVKAKKAPARKTPVKKAVAKKKPAKKKPAAKAPANDTPVAPVAQPPPPAAPSA
jgi:phosphopantothenoylcysteine synthetase/decarboxylase